MRENTDLRLKFWIDLPNFDYSEVLRAELTINQSYKNVIIRNLIIDEDSFFIDLSEQDTALLKPEKCRIQIKLVYPDGKVAATTIVERVVKGMLNKELTTAVKLAEERKVPEDVIPMHLEEEFVRVQGAGSYAELPDKPSINGVILEEDKTLKELGIVQPSVEGETLIFS